MRRTPNKRRSRRGFMMVDMVIALLVLAALSALVTVSATWSHRAASHLGDARAATALAESALSDLAQGRPAPMGVTVEPAAPEAAITGHHWVRVTAICNGRSVSLTGLAKGAE